MENTATSWRGTLKRWLIVAVQILLVLVILALLLAMWMPALIGPHPGTNFRG